MYLGYELKFWNDNYDLTREFNKNINIINKILDPEENKVKKYREIIKKRSKGDKDFKKKDYNINFTKIIQQILKDKDNDDEYDDKLYGDIVCDFLLEYDFEMNKTKIFDNNLLVMNSRPLECISKRGNICRGGWIIGYDIGDDIDAKEIIDIIEKNKNIFIDLEKYTTVDNRQNPNPKLYDAR